MTLSKIITKADLLGFEYKFFYKTSSSYKTAVGGCLSSILFVGFIITTALLSKEMFERENIFENSYEKRDLKSYIPLKEVNLMLQVSDAFGNFLTEDPEFNEAVTITPFVVRYGLEDGRYIPKFTTLSLVPCTKEFLTESYYNSVKDRFDISKMTCLNPYETLEDGSQQEVRVCGNEVGIENTIIIINVNMCGDGYVLDQDCLERMKKYNHMLMTTFFSDTYIETRNLGNITNTTERTISTKVSLGLEHHDYLTFTRNFVKEDMGIFGSDVKEYAFSVVSNKENRINTNELGSVYNLFILGQLSFRVTEIRYGKIQELLASLSGIMNTAILICRVISLFFSRFLFSNNLAAKILESKPTKPETELNLKESQQESNNTSTTLEKKENTKEVKFQNIFQFWFSIFFPKTKVSKVKSHSVVMKAMSLERILSLKQEDKEAIK